MRFSSDFEPNSDSCNSFLKSGQISALSCVVCRAVFVQCTRGKREAISLSRQAIGWTDEFLTCQKFWSLLVRVSHNWSKATNRPKRSAFSLTAHARKQYFNYLNFIAARKKTKRGRSLDKIMLLSREMWIIFHNFAISDKDKHVAKL